MTAHPTRVVLPSRMKRHCEGCAHFQDSARRHPEDQAGSCHHPQTEWNWGMEMQLMRTPEKRWPKKQPWDWCGFWRPKAVPPIAGMGGI